MRQTSPAITSRGTVPALQAVRATSATNIASRDSGVRDAARSVSVPNHPCVTQSRANASALRGSGAASVAEDAPGADTVSTVNRSVNVTMAGHVTL